MWIYTLSLSQKSEVVFSIGANKLNKFPCGGIAISVRKIVGFNPCQAELQPASNVTYKNAGSAFPWATINIRPGSRAIPLTADNANLRNIPPMNSSTACILACLWARAVHDIRVQSLWSVNCRCIKRQEQSCFTISLLLQSTKNFSDWGKIHYLFCDK